MTDKVGHLIGDALIVLSIAFTVYLIVIMISRVKSVVLKDEYLTGFKYEMAACALLIIFSTDLRFGYLSRFENVYLKAAGWSFRAVVAVTVLIVTSLFVKICITGKINTRSDSADSAIVLGLALENGKPTADLIFRTDAAKEFILNNPESSLILTGGNADEAGKTEAAVMYEILLDNGVPADRMIIEDKARTTQENFRYSLMFANADDKVVLITSGYHMDRAFHIARKAGFSNVYRMPAKSVSVTYAANVMWEALVEFDQLPLFS